MATESRRSESRRGSGDINTARRVGSPASHKLKHRGRASDGSLTFKKESISVLELEIQRGIRAIVEHAKIASQQTATDELTQSDCHSVYRVRIPADDKVPQPFTSKSHGPRAFRHVRKILSVSDEAFVDSICDHRLEMLKTPGKSGALFFRTADERYLLKTVSKGESKFFRSILFDYVAHIRTMTETHQLRTLLPHFYELIHIDTPGGRNIRLVIMNNLMPVGLHVHDSFDLKGSWVGRWTKEEEAARPGATLKDMDALHTLACSGSERTLIAEQIERDSLWLEARGIIDYSLLCLHHYPMRLAAGLVPDATPPSPDPSSTAAPPDDGSRIRGANQSIHGRVCVEDGSAEEEVVMYYGIIDILQSWRLFKRAEHAFKAVRYPTQIAGVSVTDPRSYARRFREKLMARFQTDDEARQPVGTSNGPAHGHGGLETFMV